MSIDSKYIIDLKGRKFPTWPGVLDAATNAGLKSLITTIVQVPTKENGGMAIVMARAEFEDGRVFQDVGDCSPQTTSANLAPAALRLASTRAKGRVLRDSINVAETMYEELGEEGAADDRPAYRAQGGAPKSLKCSVEGCAASLTQSQFGVSVKKYGKSICLAHQKTQSEE